MGKERGGWREYVSKRVSHDEVMRQGIWANCLPLLGHGRHEMSILCLMFFQP